jgi:N6-adenosine-specific RNA methylase IME4
MILSQPDDEKDAQTEKDAQERQHSRKPDYFYNMVRRVTAGRRIDIFAREEREGFIAWGDEVKRFIEPKQELTLEDLGL